MGRISTNPSKEREGIGITSPERERTGTGVPGNNPLYAPAEPGTRRSPQKEPAREPIKGPTKQPVPA